MTETKEIKYPRKRISIRDDVYKELRYRAKKEKTTPNQMAQQIFENYLAKCHQQG